MRVLLLILLLAVPAYAGPIGYFSDANHPPRVSTPGRGFTMQATATVPVAEKTATVLPAQVPAPIVTVPTDTVSTPFFPSSVPPILTTPQDQLPGTMTPARPQPAGPAGY